LFNLFVIRNTQQDLQPKNYLITLTSPQEKNTIDREA